MQFQQEQTVTQAAISDLASTKDNATYLTPGLYYSKKNIQKPIQVLCFCGVFFPLGTPEYFIS